MYCVKWKVNQQSARLRVTDKNHESKSGDLQPRMFNQLIYKSEDKKWLRIKDLLVAFRRGARGVTDGGLCERFGMVAMILISNHTARPTAERGKSSDIPSLRSSALGRQVSSPFWINWCPNVVGQNTNFQREALESSNASRFSLRQIGSLVTRRLNWLRNLIYFPEWD